MLVKVGWKKDLIEKSTPVMLISGLMGDALLNKSQSMAWSQGADLEVGSEEIHVDTVYDVLDKMCRAPERPVSASMRMPVTGTYKIRGVGDVVAVRVEQGVVQPGEEVVFLPTHTASNPCTGKGFIVEMHLQHFGLANLVTTLACTSRAWTKTTCHALRRYGVQKGHHAWTDARV